MGGDERLTAAEKLSSFAHDDEVVACAERGGRWHRLAEQHAAEEL